MLPPRQDPPPPTNNAATQLEPITPELQQSQQLPVGDPCDQLFPLTVIKTYVEKPIGKGAAKCKSATFFCTGRFPFASPAFTQADMVKRIYTEFGMETEYLVGVENGPAFKAWFTGMDGGKERAGTIESDVNWEEFQRRLLTTRRKDKTVFVSLDMDTLVPYRRSHQSRFSATEHANQTTSSAPQVTDFSEKERILGVIGEGIAGHWKCELDETHKTCFIDGGTGKHIPINRFRMNEWAAYILATQSDISVKEKPKPPQYLLAEWEQVPTPKPRGRGGPYSPPVTTAPIINPSNTTTSTMESLVAVLAASTTVMLNNMLQSSHASGSQQKPPTKRPASPLPDVKDWLHLCLRSFGEERGLMDDVVSAAIVALKAKGYTPNELCSDKLDVDRICKLTNLPEGVVIGLQIFSSEWVDRQTSKRARV
ncbi:hypothetical protein BJ322DRAFT_1114163 [Thelephora terrestris]|uniref:Uncharacterized protein n=1 Tax=Thelephora terrestris TaxID=56493 RepID=A0A9P6H308_9AGAM|nr:hypothetical protein BJ322DRAFT_1114163 [Thelephora terrestris]